MINESDQRNGCGDRKNTKYASLQVQMAEINGFRPYVVNPKRSLYIGYWKHSRPDGFGARHNLGGEVYDGQWKDGMRHGQGSLRRMQPDQTFSRIYVGQWKYDQKCGEGKQYYKNGMYYGWWKANKRCGLGIMWYNDGSQYVGEWENDRWHGAGVLFQENGNRYEGFFAHGQKDGEGLFYHLHTGQIQKGMWQNDVCKASMMFDCFRNKVDRPTPYPIPKTRLHKPEKLVRALLREYIPEMEIVTDEFAGRPCGEIVRAVKNMVLSIALIQYDFI